MLWGYQNGWYPEFLTDGESKLWGKLHFLARHGLKDTTVDLDELLALPGDERERMAAFLRENDLHVQPSVWYDYVGADDSRAEREHRQIVEGLETICPVMRSSAVFTRGGCGHRFDGTLPVEEKLARLSDRLKPLAAACKRLDMRLGINNQGDFYIGDFISLCERTPDLFLWVDTSNIFWAGEPIFPAFEEAAPLTIATHWRDEKIVIGNKKPRGVLLENCVTGQGDVDLRHCYRTLLDRAPNPEGLLMEIELFPPRGMDRHQALDQALAFCRELNGGAL